MKRILSVVLFVILSVLMLSLSASACAQSAIQTALDAGRAYSATAALYLSEDWVGAETSQLIESGALHLYAQGGDEPLAAASVSAGETEVFSLILEPEDDALYAATQAGVVRLSEESLLALGDRLSAYAVSRGYVTEAELQQLIDEAEGISAPAQPAETAEYDYAPLIDALERLVSDVEYVPASELDMSTMVCDPVSEMMILHISSDNLLTFLSEAMDCIRSDADMLAAFEAGLAQSGVTMAELEQVLPQLEYALRALMADDFVVDVGFNNAGEVVFAAAELCLNAAEAGVTFYASYNRVTDGSGAQSHALTFLGMTDDTPFVYITAEAYPLETGYEICVDFYNGSEEYIAVLSHMQFAEGETDVSEHYLQLGVFEGEGVTLLAEGLYKTEERFLEGGTDAERVTQLIFQPAGENAVFSLAFVENTCAPEAGSIVSEDAFRPESITQEDFDVMLDALIQSASAHTESP